MKAASKFLAMSMMMGAMAGMSNRSNFIPDEIEPLTEKEKENLLERQNESKGLKKFSYTGKFVWTLNKKNADKKAKKIGYI